MANESITVLTNTRQPNKEDLKLPTYKFPLSNYYHYNFTSETPLNLKLNYNNHFLNAIMTAYNYHLPLRISPDDILLAINNIVSRYINEDPIKFRNLFVNHKGKKVILVNTNNPTLINRINSKNSILDVAVEECARIIINEVKNKEFISSVMCNFTTSTDIDRLCSMAYIMDMTKEYFEFKYYTLCGIPSLILCGTKDDWEKLLDKVLALSKLETHINDSSSTNSNVDNSSVDSSVDSSELKKYIDVNLVYIIKMFIQAKEKVTKEVETFFSEIISHKSYRTSGGDSYTHWSGWITNFFPFIKKSEVKYDWDKYKKHSVIKIYNDCELKEVPSGITNVPVKIDDVDYNLRAGFQGTEQLADGAVGVIKGYYFEKQSSTKDVKRTKDKQVTVDDVMYEEVLDKVVEDVIADTDVYNNDPQITNNINALKDYILSKKQEKD